MIDLAYAARKVFPKHEKKAEEEAAAAKAAEDAAKAEAKWRHPCEVSGLDIPN